MVDEATFEAAVAPLFKRLVKAVDAADPDAIEADSTGDMVTITGVKSGQKVIVNTQRAVRQIWVAGKGAGVHFSLGADGRWMDDKGHGVELFAWLAECVRAASNLDLAL